MNLFRITHCQRALDCTGNGAKLYGGRWNSVGVAIHYMAANRALAALEVLVNSSRMNLGSSWCLSIFEVPEVSIQEIKIHDLPSDWRDYPASQQLKRIGDQFVLANQFLLLKVPSCLIEDEFNYLMNPLHPLATELKVVASKPFSFDTRFSN